LGIDRSVSALLGATLAAAHIHIMYSGRVKTYTLDVLIVLGLVVAVAGLANIKWRWHTAAAWIVAAALSSSLSGFALVATAAAGIVFLLHPTSDRRVRFVAVGAQAILQLILLLAIQRTYDARELEVFWARSYDAYLDFDVNPIRFAAELREHLSRVAHVFPGGSGWLPTLCMFVALLGLLGAASTKRISPRAVAARYLVIVLVIAIVGGVLDRFPFGPARGGGTIGNTFFPATFSRGERASLWLIPLVAVGLAVTLQAVRRLGADRRWLRVSFDSLAYLIAAIVLIIAVGHDAPPYAVPGSESAVRFVQSELGKDDALLVVQGGHYQLALESDFDASIQERPHESIGFVPTFADPRVHVVEFEFHRPVSPHVSRHTREAIAGADRVFVYSGSHVFTTEFVATQEPVLRSQGFRKRATIAFGAEIVWIWEKSPDGAPDL
jgi:hypothetical protein